MDGFDSGSIAYAFPYMPSRVRWSPWRSRSCALALATLVGLVSGLLISASELTLLKPIIRAYVYSVRGTPALVQIFPVYFALAEDRAWNCRRSLQRRRRAGVQPGPASSPKSSAPACT